MNHSKKIYIKTNKCPHHKTANGEEIFLDYKKNIPAYKCNLCMRIYINTPTQKSGKINEKNGYTIYNIGEYNSPSHDEHYGNIGTSHRYIEVFYLTSVKNIKNCLICSAPLFNRTIKLDCTKSSNIEYKGLSCGRHRFVFKGFEKFLDDTSKMYIKLDYTYEFNGYEDVYGIYEEQDCFYHFIVLKNKRQKESNKFLLIGSDRKNLFHICKNLTSATFLDYKDTAVRKLLSEVIKEKKKSVIFEGDSYDVCCLHSKQDTLNVNHVCIKSGGGYSRSIINKSYRLVDLLLFSPYTQQYEIIHSTYDGYEYYVDITIFRAFVRQYGNPGINVYSYNQSKKETYLNDESILHAYGYNVNQQDNLSQRLRQEILAEVIDLGLMTMPSIIRLLTGCYDRSNGKGNRYACFKYAADIEFVKNYKYNPDRFLIIQ